MRFTSPRPKRRIAPRSRIDVTEERMTKQGIYTAIGPVANAPYTPGVRVGNLVFVSGQVPLDPATSMIVEGGFEEQVRQCLRNLAEILKQEHLGLDDVVKTTVFLSDLKNFAEMNKIYGSYFHGVKPARSCVQ